MRRFTFLFLTFIFMFAFGGIDSAAAAPAETFYTGDRGGNISVAVFSPAGKGLAENEDYLPALVQGVLINDFTKLPVMEVPDRESLDRILKEKMSGYYPGEADTARFGEIVPSAYLMTGTLTKDGTGYALKLTVAESKTSRAMWTHSSVVRRAELEDFSAIKKAGEDLLAQMGVTLSAAGRAALYEDSRQVMDAQKALARGVTAQRGGAVAAAFTFYYEAAAYNAGLPEADKRLADLTKIIESGNIGEKGGSEIQQAQAWGKLLDEAAAFYNKFPVADIVYNTKARQGQINMQNQTFEVSWDIWLEPNTRFDAMLTIARALDKTGKTSAWGLDEKLAAMLTNGSSLRIGSYYYLIVFAELTDDAGNYLGDSKLGYHSAAGGYDAPMSIQYGGGNAYVKNNRNALDEPVRLPLPMQLYFTGVDANTAGGGMKPVFLEAGKATRGDFQAKPIVNAIENIRVTATDKSFADYFKGRRTYKQLEDGLHYSKEGFR